MSILNTITFSLFTVIFILAIFTALREEEFAKAVAGAVVVLCLFGLYFSIFGERAGNMSKGE